MSVTRWKLVEEIFHAVIEKPPAERAGYLDRACGEDLELRREVESLLLHEAGAVSILKSAVSAAAGKLPSKPGSYIGTTIGPYHVIRELGSGGMGAVYLAMRSDQHYLQTVAIKLMKYGAQSDEITRRFRNERQILATLNHPNIAAILDGGCTADGLPYIVMEFIEGRRISEFAKDRQLSVRERISLFRSVCFAVHHAHQKLVIHRDIKPSNILVTPEGIPKLLDFGVAKLLIPELAPGDLTLTAAPNRMMTPDYASPEQILGEPLTTSSDIYSLGVVLFELLTESRPYSTVGLSQHEIERVVSQQTTTRPSEVPGLPRRVEKELRGDLENIVLMAMRKEPARRYKSALQLAEDLSRYLEGQPVIAHPDSRAYRLSKLLGRHKTIAVALVSLFFALLAGAITTSWQARVANRERAAAEREAEFLQGMFQAATPDEAAGRTITARDLLDRGAHRLDIDLASAPDVRAAMLENIGAAYRSLGLYDEALLFTERAWELKKKLYGARNLKSSGALENMAELYRDKGRFEQAEPLLRQALATRKTALGENNELVATSLANLGECLYWEDKNAEAETVLRRSIAIYRSSNSPALPAPENYLALVLERTGSYTQVIRLLHEALAVTDRRYGEQSVLYADTLHNLGGALIDTGDLIESEEVTRQAGDVRMKVIGREHPDRLYSLNNLVFILVEEGKADAAQQPLNEAIAVAHKLFGELHPRVATLYKNEGRLQALNHNYGAAEASYRKALDILQKVGQTQGHAAAAVFISFAQLELDRGKPAKAKEYARQALDIYERVGGDRSPLIANALIELGLAEEFTGSPGTAEPLFRRALTIRRDRFGTGSPAALAAQVRLAEALTAAGKAAQAEPLLEEAVSLTHRSPVPLLRWQMGEAESALGECLLARGQTQRAEPFLRNTLNDDPHALWTRVAADRQRRLHHALLAVTQ